MTGSLYTDLELITWSGHGWGCCQRRDGSGDSPFPPRGCVKDRRGALAGTFACRGFTRLAGWPREAGARPQASYVAVLQEEAAEAQDDQKDEEDDGADCAVFRPHAVDWSVAALRAHVAAVALRQIRRSRAHKLHSTLDALRPDRATARGLS